MKDDEDEVLVSMEQQDTRELETKGGGELHGIGFTITKVTACTQLAEMHTSIFHLRIVNFTWTNWYPVIFKKYTCIIPHPFPLQIVDGH